MTIKLLKFIHNEGNFDQTSTEGKTESTLEVADKTTLRGRFSPSFSLKTAFQSTGLHPLEQMATPFRADNYTLLNKGCSLPDKINPYAISRFLPWERAFPSIETTVSSNGNSNFFLTVTYVSLNRNDSFLNRERQFPTVGKLQYTTYQRLACTVRNY